MSRSIPYSVMLMWIGPIAQVLLQLPVGGVVGAERAQVVDAELVPDEHVGQHVVRLGVAQDVGGAGRAPAGVAGAADPGVAEAVPGIDLLDLLVRGGPVGQELGPSGWPSRVPVAAVGLVERDEHVVLGYAEEVATASATNSTTSR
jgi:hypothetical protein